jgi:hypothetical protein
MAHQNGMSSSNSGVWFCWRIACCRRESGTALGHSEAPQPPEFCVLGTPAAARLVMWLAVILVFTVRSSVAIVSAGVFSKYSL